jgi:hypothetical protein
MKAVVAVLASQPTPSVRTCAFIAGLALLPCASSVCAEPHGFTAATANTAHPQLEVSSSTLPRFDGVDSAMRSSRVDLALMPQRRSGIGLAFGVGSPSGANRALGPGYAGAPFVDLGVHWRYTLDSNYRFDVTAYRRMPNSDAISLIESRDPTYGARVELKLGSIARSNGFVASKGFLGFQLESGARVTVKRSGGVPMLYYRNTF